MTCVSTCPHLSLRHSATTLTASVKLEYLNQWFNVNNIPMEVLTSNRGSAVNLEAGQVLNPRCIPCTLSHSRRNGSLLFLTLPHLGQNHSSQHVLVKKNNQNRKQGHISGELLVTLL